MTPFAPLRPLAPLLLLTGCAGVPDGYPSLAVRPEESLSITTPIPDQTTSSPSAGQELRATLSGLEAEATEGWAEFDREIGPAERDAAAASGAAFDSEPWTVAQQSVSRADAALVATAASLAETDRLLADLRLAAAQKPGTAGLTEAIETRRRIADAHRARVDRLDAVGARLR